MIPLFDLSFQNAPLTSSLTESFQEILSSNQFILGAQVTDFETKCSKFLGSKHTVGVSSGSDALILALKSLGIGPGDEVILPSFTFIATASAICWVGAKPVFVDINSETFNISVESFEAAITSKTKAVIPVHLYGLPINLEEILKISNRHNIFIIEDAAQAFGATINDRKVGTFGSLGCFSFFPTKPLGGFGDGGLISVNSLELLEKILAMRQQRSIGSLTFSQMGGNFRLDALQAALLSIKIDYVDLWRERREQAAKKYLEIFSSFNLNEKIVLPKFPEDYLKSSWALFTIRVQKRPALIQFLREKGIGCAIYYPQPLHLQKIFSNYTYSVGSLPESERVSQEVLSLPLFAGISERQIYKVVRTIKDFFDA